MVVLLGYIPRNSLTGWIDWTHFFGSWYKFPAYLFIQFSSVAQSCLTLCDPMNRSILAVQGTFKSLLQHHSSKASILRCSAFFTVQLSHQYMTTGKTIALTKQTFVGKVVSLLFSMLSRLSLILKFNPSTTPQPHYSKHTHTQVNSWLNLICFQFQLLL